MSSEFDRIRAIAGSLARARPDVRVGIGDDAAVVLPPPGEELVVTVDAQVEGVHFRRDLLSWEDVGYRAFMAAASDIAAMGARPLWALSALTLPADFEDAALAAMTSGLASASEGVCAVIGGNLARGPALSITTTVIGACARALGRGGAKPGDGLWLAGDVGLAGAGFRALDKKVQDARIGAAVAAWRRPVARFEEGRRAGAVGHAAIDVSDGLAQDAGHLAVASGVRLVFDDGALATRALLDAADALGADAIDLALFGGEDYALVVASDAPIEGFRRIGVVEAGSGVVCGDRALDARGFDHFR